MNDIFDINNFKYISESEYLFAKKNLHELVFSFFYQKGIAKNYETKSKSADNISELKSQETVFTGYDFSLEQKEKLFNYFGKENLNKKLNENNETFKKLKEQIKKVNNIIEPVLNELGIKYELHLSGGSMRDHLLDKEIKDIDLLIEFHDDFQIAAQTGKNSSERLENLKNTVEKFFEEKSEIIKKHKLNIFKGQSREKILHEIVFQLMKRQKDYEVKDFFSEEENKKTDKNQSENSKSLTESDETIYDGLFSVLKIQNEKFIYPMDLLLNGNKFTYLNSFDFDICKFSYTFKSLNDKNEQLYIYEGFVKDVIEEKLSLNACLFQNQKQVDRCLKGHYLRLKNKYPHHKFELLEKSSNQEMIEYILKAQAYYALEDKLKYKEDKPKLKTKKI